MWKENHLQQRSPSPKFWTRLVAIFSASITIFGEVDLDIGRNSSVDTYKIEIY